MPKKASHNSKANGRKDNIGKFRGEERNHGRGRNRAELEGEELSPVEMACLDEYLRNGGNRILAIRTAYPDAHTLTYGQLQVKVRGIFNRPEAKKYIRKMRAELNKLYEVSTARIIREYANMAYVNPLEFFEADGTVKNPALLPAHVAAAISSYEYDPTTGKRKIKWIDRRAALHDLGRYLGIFEKDNKQRSAGLVELFRELDIGGIPAPTQEAEPEEDGEIDNS